ncbi:alpha/beta hydrolase fold [Ferrithrix thermotolerans DSM 19514]|jgi:2-hydroxymuconate-semialdehyde hydrolase|uniref:Alpha/beta hydrolase fold n=1 Tax=Ferrithrix thermotolerans DSM 19514 TaxID=1121881 RepID=A0A1M4V1P4_9ACTN|nr:alpha/beta hydrolase [Ferrithrix thermotolerans]SHE62875.1 alpha/beta hydrolase fold [Ferrithrix thermotolerans DSM 19514]
MPRLSQEFRVVAPDLPGFGYTTVPDGFVFSLDKWVRHLFGFAKALELENFALVGNSFGGALAIASAIANPRLISHLILMGAVGLSFLITRELETVWGFDPDVSDMKDLLDLFVYDRSIVTEDLIASRDQAARRPETSRSFKEMFLPPYQQRLDYRVSATYMIEPLEMLERSLW